MHINLSESAAAIVKQLVKCAHYSTPDSAVNAAIFLAFASHANGGDRNHERLPEAILETDPTDLWFELPHSPGEPIDWVPGPQRLPEFVE